MMRLNKIVLLLLLMCAPIISAQTAGFNYQALILNEEEIQIPGTDAIEKVPLALADVALRFTITNEVGIEYTEVHTTITDENGMVSLIVGTGTPTYASFSNIIWDGEVKSINVELNILDSNEGFVFLDAQDILYLPYPKNKLGLVVVDGDIEREDTFINAKEGDQIWNKSCNCMQVFNGDDWVSKIIDGVNGISKLGGTLSLGGPLIQPTEITTTENNTLAIKGLEKSTNINDYVVVVDGQTGILKKKEIQEITKITERVIYSKEGQLEFTTPLSTRNHKNIEVYRNGIRIDFTIMNSSTIQLESEAICYKNDHIRIVQTN